MLCLMRHIQRDIVSALIFSRDGKLLQGRKNSQKGGVYTDHWHIPGGGIDKNEDKVIALIREIKEETGLDISSYKIELVDDRGYGKSEKVLKGSGEKVLCEMKFNVYRVDLLQNANEVQLQPTDDLEVLRWFSMDELKKSEITPPSRELFKKLGYL